MCSPAAAYDVKRQAVGGGNRNALEVAPPPRCFS
jgi:hypothetical protein